MPEVLIGGLFAIVAAMVGGLVVHIANRATRSLEVQKLELEVEELKYQVKAREKQVERAELETAKLRLELSEMLRREFKVRTPEF